MRLIKIDYNFRGRFEERAVIKRRNVRKEKFRNKNT